TGRGGRVRRGGSRGGRGQGGGRGPLGREVRAGLRAQQPPQDLDGGGAAPRLLRQAGRDQLPQLTGQRAEVGLLVQDTPHDRRYGVAAERRDEIGRAACRAR